MIGLGKATLGSSQAIDYVLNDKENGPAEELLRNGLSGEDGTEILQELRDIQSENTRCRNNTYSFVLSPDSKRSFTSDELRVLTKEHLHNLGLDKHQYIAAIHRSTDQPHVHIICNRIGMDGKAHSDKYIGLKCQQSAEGIAKKHHLTLAKERSHELTILENNRNLSLKSHIKTSFYASAKDSTSITQLQTRLQEKGILMKMEYNKQGKIKGMSFECRGVELNASQVDRSLRPTSLHEIIPKEQFSSRQQKEVSIFNSFARSRDTNLLKGLSFAKDVTKVGSGILNAVNPTAFVAKQVLSMAMKIQDRGMSL